MVILMFLVVGILTSITSKTLIAQVSNEHIALSPIQGPTGISVSVNGGDFIGQTTISFNGVTVAKTTPASTGFILVEFTVPSVAPGIYDVTAHDSKGNSATTKFTITAYGASPSTTASSSGTSRTSTYQPNQSPVIQNVGFWSPIVIAAIVAVAAFAIIIPMTLVLRSRSKQAKLLEKEPLPYRSEPHIQSNQPTSRYNQPTTYGQNLTKPNVTNRYRQPSSNVQQSAFEKTCPHCNRVIKGDYNTCPYCYKKIR